MSIPLPRKPDVSVLLRSCTRFATLAICVLGVLVSAVWWFRYGDGRFALAVFAALLAVGIRDLLQTRHAILRNYPVIGHLRFLFEYVRPEIRQYFIESDAEAAPFSRAKRALVYQRAKGERTTVRSAPSWMSARGAMSG